MWTSYTANRRVLASMSCGRLRTERLICVVPKASRHAWFHYPGMLLHFSPVGPGQRSTSADDEELTTSDQTPEFTDRDSPLLENRNGDAGLPNVELGPQFERCVKSGTWQQLTAAQLRGNKVLALLLGGMPEAWVYYIKVIYIGYDVLRANTII